MDKNLFSLSKLFTERLYRIPDYQRGYAWTEKQLRDFWSDLEQLEKGKNHYLGVLTLEAVPLEIVKQWRDDRWIVESKSYDPFYIVDGQQRLTTVVILIQAILECADKSKKLNYSDHNEIKKKFIFDSKDDGISKSYMFGYEKDNPSYEFLKTRIFGELSESSDGLRETVYTQNLEFAKNFFVEKLSLLAHSEQEEIFRKITQHLQFNLYTISDDIDVFVAFETMNNRGKPLSQLELLKNRLIYLSTKFQVDEHEKDRLRASVNEAWKSIYHNLGKNKDKPLDDDIFLNNHSIIYFQKELLEEEEILVDARRGRIISKRTYGSFLLEKKFTVRNILGPTNGTDDDPENILLSIKDVYSYVQSLKISVELWYKIATPKDSDFSSDEKLWLDRLNRFESRKATFSSCPPLIMIFFQKEKNSTKRVKFLKALERNYFFSLLCFMYPSGLFYNFMEWAGQLSKDLISSDTLIRKLEERSDEVIKAKDFLDQVKSEWRSEGFYKWRAIRYFLYEYDLYLQSRSKTSRIKIDWERFVDSFEHHDYKTIEHIYPQNPGRRDCWASRFNQYSSKEKTILRNSLGNLLPLSQPKNSSFQNKCFSEKVSGNGSDTVGYRYGSYSEIEVTQYQDWTAKEILDRGIKLLEFMEKRWNFTLGDRAQKIDFLGLNFVVQKEQLELQDKPV